MTTAVVDNTVLSNFAHVARPELLREAFDDLVTSRAVMDELVEGVRLGRMPSVDWLWLPVIELTPEEQVTVRVFEQTLGLGEAECIALAQSREWIVLTDDRDARRVSKEAGVSVSGTLGALMNLVHHKIVTFATGDSLLTEMKQHGYRCPIDSLKDLDNEEG